MVIPWDRLRTKQPKRYPISVYISSSTRLNLPPIIWTCRQIRREYLSLWVPAHSLRLQSLDLAHRWTTSLGPEFTEFLSELCVHVQSSATPPDVRREIRPYRPRLKLIATYAVNKVGGRTLNFSFLDGRLCILPTIVLESDSIKFISTTLSQTFGEVCDLTWQNFLTFIEKIANTPLRCRLIYDDNGFKLRDREILELCEDMEREETQGDQSSGTLDGQDDQWTIVKVSSYASYQVGFQVMAYSQQDETTESLLSYSNDDTPLSLSSTSSDILNHSTDGRQSSERTGTMKLLRSWVSFIKK